MRRFGASLTLSCLVGCTESTPTPKETGIEIQGPVVEDDAAEVPVHAVEKPQDEIVAAEEEAPETEELEPKDKPPIYEERALTDEDIADALDQAREEKKHVLLMFGGNWCGWCHKLHELMEADDTIKSTLATGYVLVMVDSHNNEELAKKFDIELKGVPYLAVLDTEAKVLVRQETGSLEDGPKHDPQKVLAFLDQWRPKA